MDTRAAEYAVERTKWLNDTLFDQLSTLNKPFAEYGSASFDKLANLLGVEKPDQMKFNDFDSFWNSIVDTGGYNREKFSKDANRLYYDPVTGKVSGVSAGGLDLGIKAKAGGGVQMGAIEPYKEQARKFYDEMVAQDNAPKGEDFGSLLESFTMDDYQQSPNYQFNLEEGEKAINRAAASRGDYLSPEAVKDLTQYSQNLASNEFLNSYNMFNQDRGSIYDMLMGATGVGQQGVAQQGASNAAYVGQTSDLEGQLAQLGLASQADKAAKKSSAFSNLASIAGTAIGGAFGGPMGAQIGGQLGSAVGGGGGFNPSAILGMGSSAGLWGGFDPKTGITWNSGRYF